MGSSEIYREVLLVAAMVATLVLGVGLNTLFKAAASKGMSYFVFVFYSNLFNTLLLLPVPFFLCRRRVVPLFKFPLLSRLATLGVIGCCSQVAGYKGVKYSSPTMASTMSNLLPAWTFLFALLFRIEKVNLRSRSSQSKMCGTVVSILGALMVVFYKGPMLLSTSPLSNWVLGGFLLALQHILYAFLFIIQTQMMQICPSELLISFFSYLFTTVVSAPICFLGESNWSAWKIKPDITLVVLIYSGTLGGALLGILHLWCLRLKGPIYVASFMPLTIAIAAAMSFIFLGDALHLGSVIGAVLISIGVYGVIWGKAKEEKGRNELESSSSLGSNANTTPLLQSLKVEHLFES